MMDLLFEVSWEVCNKVGGIYAVLSTKANTLVKIFGKNNVIFIGPDFGDATTFSPYFTESKQVLMGWKERNSLPCDIKVRTGRWNVPGNPIAVLIDFKGVSAIKNDVYGEMWEKFGVDSLHSYGDYDESCLFGIASSIVIQSILASKKVKGNVIAHFDEWTTGMGLLHLKTRAPHVATVFTTHATSIGRSICGNGKPLYDYMEGYNGNQMAQELNMQSKHSLERAAAHAADAFTTVSEVTVRECEQLLERRPLVTPNAFEPEFVPSGAILKSSRIKIRKKILEVASSLTGLTLGEDTFIVGTSGRCEYRNKGLDVFLDAMNVLRADKEGRKILALVMVPSWERGARADLVKSLADGVHNRLNDPFVTHELVEQGGDCVLRKIHDTGFTNLDDERVVVMYVPSYLTGNDGIFDETYYDMLLGLDATVFASYYEPWGYTPLESVAFGVPTITTDLAGFGQWVKDSLGDDLRKTGVKVIHRSDSNYSEAVHATASEVEDIASLDVKTKKLLNEAARCTAEGATWPIFFAYYKEAYRLAVSNKNNIH